MDELILEVARESGIDISALVAVDGKTIRQRDDFKARLEALLPDEDGYKEVDVILTGSFARGEVTEGSDCDYLITSLNTVGHRIMPFMVKTANRVVKELGFESPGSQGVFGDFTPAADLIWRIGLDGDSNTNTTRRTLILTESVSVWQREIRKDLLNRMLSRYCADYNPRWTDNKSLSVTRFLLNDIVRYWRTIAVDFGAKQWLSVRSDMGLRHAKLLTTRKILFAGSIMTLFLASTVVPNSNTPGQELYNNLKSYLIADFERPPLARLLSAYRHVSPGGKAALSRLLESYARFIGILDDPGKRDLIKAGPDATADESSLASARSLMSDVESIGDVIQSSLETIFFDEDMFKDLTRKYAVF